MYDILFVDGIEPRTLREYATSSSSWSCMAHSLTIAQFNHTNHDQDDRKNVQSKNFNKIKYFLYDAIP